MRSGSSVRHKLVSTAPEARHSGPCGGIFRSAFYFKHEEMGSECVSVLLVKKEKKSVTCFTDGEMCLEIQITGTSSAVLCEHSQALTPHLIDSFNRK